MNLNSAEYRRSRPRVVVAFGKEERIGSKANPRCGGGLDRKTEQVSRTLLKLG